MIALTCTSCQKNLSVNDELAGINVQCPSCGERLIVPGAGTPTSPAPGPVCKDSVSGAEGETGISGGMPGDATGTWAGAASSPAAWDFLAPAEQPDELGRLGPFRILQVLGAGGMGVVFKAVDPELNRPVALKAMLPALAAGESARKRFVREAQAAAAVVHDHVVRILQVGEDRGVPFLAMQFLEGESLADRLQRAPRLTIGEMLRIGRETALGLAAAHQQGLIHRDIKPANLWLESRPAETFRVKVLDFGLARAAADDAQLTQSGAILGTPAFMAPEQAAGAPVDHRADLFSLGCVLYRLVTDTMPFKGKDAIAMLLAVATEDPRPPSEIRPDLPPALSDLVMQLLAKDARERPESAQAVLEMLNAIVAGSPGPAAPRRSGRRRRRPVRRRRIALWLGLGVVGIVLMAGLLAFLLWWDGRLALLLGGPPPGNHAGAKPDRTPEVPPPVYELGKDGLTLEGSVAAADATISPQGPGDLPHDLHGKLFLVQLSAGKRYRITLDSHDFDPFLFIEDQAGQQGAADDDSGGDLNALLIYDPAKDGIYRVGVASFDGNLGKFILKVQEFTPVAIHDVGKDGLTLVDTIATTDAKLVTMKKGKEVRQLHAKAFQVRLAAGKKYRIAMDSAALDSYLSVRGPTGHTVAWDDESGAMEEDALVRLEVFKDGVYTIHAASYRGQGTFTLNVKEDGAVQVHEVGPGLNFTRSLESVDSITFCVRLQAGKTYVIDMCSKDLTKVDPWLHLLAEDGKPLAEDHGGGEGGNARIRFKAFDTGIYRVVADAFQLEDGCEFVLAIRPDAEAQSWRDGDSWVVDDGVLQQTDRGAARWLLFGDLAWTDYNFEVEAQVIAGSEIDIGFRIASPADLLYVALGSFANTHHGLLQKRDGGPQPVATLEWVDGQTKPDCWYRVRIEVRGDDCKVLLDGKLLLKSAGSAKAPRGCVGIGTVNASARFRNPKITTPGGKILMDRWPADLPKTKQVPKAGRGKGATDHTVKVSDFGKVEQVRTINAYTKPITRVPIVGHKAEFIDWGGDNHVKACTTTNGEATVQARRATLAAWLTSPTRTAMFPSHVV